ncbi:oligosaccharide flippase family protein [Serratia marcescens]|uniref:oligosaccharide flippase family protein n=1 Tax=Serratia TaxID=613 RepID=UPI001574D1C3|nr:oligosaccharide flippase family protein [Serratia marcescens]NSM19814.1 oligosaccharide flippase family protein [Serratia marcescens]NSM46512.1 oligosaccharide flippase family protein [Serratia marcescens]BEN57244.1 flippase [Serratia marcescens]
MNISVLKNFSWMVIEKIVSVFGLIFVTSYVAKYIGPSAFGTIAFAISVFGIVQAVSLFGTETILFKRISSNERSGIRLMLSAKKLRRSIFSVLATVLIIYFYFMTDTLTFVFCLAASIAAYFFSQDVIAIYNDAALNSKFNAFANVIGLGVSLLLRLVVVHANLDIKFLAIPIITTAVIPYYIRLSFFKMRHRGINGNRFRDRRYIIYMLYAGLPLAISGISISIYTRLSQVLLAKFGTTAELGLFAAANTLASSWAFISLAFITSSFAIIYKESDREKSINEAARLNGIVLLFCLVTVTLIIIFGRFFISVLYGEQYRDAYPIMIILAVATAFSAMGPVAYRYIIKESGYKFISYKTFFVFIINFPLSMFLISHYSVLGAAYSMLITEFISLTVLNYLFNQGVVARIHIKTFNPFLYLKGKVR